MTDTKAQTTCQLTRVLIVDDHDLVRRGLAALIEGDPQLEVCGHAVDVDAAMEIVRTAKPNLIIVDISLKDSNGMDLIKQVRAYDDSILMLVSSMHDESLYAERVLRAGASGYVNKEEASDKVLDAIHTVLDGSIYLSPQIKPDVLLRLAKSSDGDDQPDINQLSDRELEVFELIGRGRRTREIADSLHLSIKTIETYRDNIKSKLKLDTGTDLICRAVRWVVEQRLG
jgi:DNA-binding NarL/FixJ family response regulator